MKVLLYCTKASPYLEKGGDPTCKDEYQLFDWVCEEDKKTKVLNGLVCFECEVNEAFRILDSGGYCSAQGTVGDKDFSESEYQKFLKRACLSEDEINSYLGIFSRENHVGSLLGYAYHFENVKPIDPMPITQLYRDGTMAYPLTRAPQSYCFAYRKAETTKEDYLANVGKDESRYYLQENGKFFYSEKVLVFFIRSPYVALELNIDPVTGKPFKDLEVRNRKVMNAGIEYK